MTKLNQTFISSLLAGVMISIGATAYISMDNRIAGALLFSIGLLAILIFKNTLYTGMIGYVDSIKKIPIVLTTILGNTIGAYSILIWNTNTSKALEIYNAKLNNPLTISFGKAILCGILIYVAVDTFKKFPNVIVVILSVMTFILTGAEHSIADLCFMFAAQQYSLKSLLFIVVILIGNAFGSIVFNLLECSIGDR